MPQATPKTAYLFTGQGVLPADIISFFTKLQNKNPDKTGKYINLLQSALNDLSQLSEFNVAPALENETSDAWNRTEFVQPLIYTLSMLAFENYNNSAQFVLGHSLGAFSAAASSGLMNFETGLRLVAARGKYMQEESEKTGTGMIAVLGLTENHVLEICKSTRTQIALINAPTAYVLGGLRTDLSAVEKEAAQKGARKTFILTTSGAFHTTAMQGAYEKIKKYVQNINFQKPQIPVITNSKGASTLDKDEVINDLIESTTHKIDWASMMSYLKNENITSYIETGAGNFLSALCRLNGIEREKTTHISALLE